MLQRRLTQRAPPFERAPPFGRLRAGWWESAHFQAVCVALSGFRENGVVSPRPVVEPRRDTPAGNASRWAAVARCLTFFFSTEMRRNTILEGSSYRCPWCRRGTHARCAGVIDACRSQPRTTARAVKLAAAVVPHPIMSLAG